MEDLSNKANAAANAVMTEKGIGLGKSLELGCGVAVDKTDKMNTTSSDIEALIEEKSRLLDLALGELHASQRSQGEVVRILQANTSELQVLQASLSGMNVGGIHTMQNAGGRCHLEIPFPKAASITPPQAELATAPLSFPHQQQHVDVSPNLTSPGHGYSYPVFSPMGAYAYPAPRGRLGQVSPRPVVSPAIVRRESPPGVRREIFASDKEIGPYTYPAPLGPGGHVSPCPMVSPRVVRREVSAPEVYRVALPTFSRS